MSNVRVCFVGDSFVAGVGDPHHAGWVGRIAARAHHAGLPLTTYNLGVRRQTSVQVAARLVAECAPRLPKDCQGRLVVSSGVNDTTVENGRRRVPLAESVGALGDVLDEADGRGWPVLVVGPPPVADAGQNERTAELDQRFAQLCCSRGCPYVPTLNEMQSHETWMLQVALGDGAHPAAEGYELLADLVWPSWWAWLVNRDESETGCPGATIPHRGPRL